MVPRGRSSAVASWLVRVVRTRPVRAMPEKYYGRVARMSVLPERSAGSGLDDARGLALRQALSELESVPDTAPTPCISIRHARLAPERAAELAERVEALSVEFGDEAQPGAPVYGLVTALYETAWPSLPDDPGPGP